MTWWRRLRARRAGRWRHRARPSYAAGEAFLSLLVSLVFLVVVFVTAASSMVTLHNQP